MSLLVVISFVLFASLFLFFFCVCLSKCVGQQMISPYWFYHLCHRKCDATTHRSYWIIITQWWKRISIKSTLILKWHWAIQKKNYSMIISKFCYANITNVLLGCNFLIHIHSSGLQLLIIRFVLCPHSSNSAFYTLSHFYLWFSMCFFLFRFWLHCNRKSQLLALLLCIGSADIALGNQQAEQRFLDVLRDLYKDGVLNIEELSF